jgi:hypothetical protein
MGAHVHALSSARTNGQTPAMYRMIVCAIGMLAGCSESEALEAGDCPSAPTHLAIDPVAPFSNGLVLLEFQSNNAPGSVEVQHHSPSRDLWEPQYGPLGQKDDGTFVVQVRPQLSATDANAGSDFKLRARSLLDGCPPSDWAETEAVPIGDPITTTTWVEELGPTDLSSQINAAVTSGTGTSIGPYRISTTPPVRHTITFAAAGVLSESFDIEIQSATAGDVYGGCHFKIAIEGSWAIGYDYDERIAVYGRHITSLAGSTCANPAVSELRLTPPPSLSDDFLYPSNIDYSRLLEEPVGPATWRNVGLVQQSFSTILSSLEDQMGPNTAALSGYLSVLSSQYRRQN